MLVGDIVVVGDILVVVEIVVVGDIVVVVAVFDIIVVDTLWTNDADVDVAVTAAEKIRKWQVSNFLSKF